MRRKVLRTIRQYQMIAPGDHIVVGFSGGADSTALLALLWELRLELSITVSACHLNHQLRAQEANRDEAFVRDFCAQRGIPLTVESQDIAANAAQQRQSVELYVRQQRYELFERLAADFPQGKIATAHNLNDNAETMLFYLARGTGMSGMGGIPPVRGRVIRPLIGCTRAEIETFCHDAGLSFVTDSTNLSDDYTRNRIRHYLVPLMEQLNGAFLEHADQLSQTARLEDNFLEELCSREYECICLDSSGRTLDRQRFLALHPAVQRRILVLLLRREGIQPDFERVGLMQQRVAVGRGKTELKYGIALKADEAAFSIDREVFYRNRRQPYFEHPLVPGVCELFRGKCIEVKICSMQEYKLFFNKDHGILKNSFDCDKMKDIAVVRQRREGDRITLKEQGGSRPLKKIWNEARTPQEERWRAAVISDAQGVVWVEGFGCDRRVLPDENSKRMVWVRIKEEQR